MNGIIQLLTIQVEQSTIFRQGNHISPYFSTIIFNVLKQILAISFICRVETYLDSIGKKEINLFLRKMQKIYEIKNKWRNMATWRNMVLCSTTKTGVGGGGGGYHAMFNLLLK